MSEQHHPSPFKESLAYGDMIITAAATKLRRDIDNLAHSADPQLTVVN